MQRRQRKVTSSILLTVMLAVGPLNAQVVFACSMMDAVFHDNRCCDEHKDCADQDYDEPLEKERDPCCERFVELSVDHELPHFLKPIEVRTDVDPPLLVAAIDLSVSACPTTTIVRIEGNIAVCSHGSNTYLTTQRLRI